MVYHINYYLIECFDVMSDNLNLNEVIKCVKNIVDSVRCVVCDKAGGGRVRLQCGHSTCDGCVIVSEGCLLCLTPPKTLAKSVADEPFTRRAVNACNLLTICEDIFSLDVYRRSRISEQLKAEKELFPQCIQAPVQYFNKRKSLISKSKENWGCSYYPGEGISRSESFKMNRCNNYVQQWLNNTENQPSKAFSDLDVNRLQRKALSDLGDNKNIIYPNKTKNKQNSTKLENQKVTGSKSRKRLHSNNSHSLLERNITKNVKKDSFKIFQNVNKKEINNVTDESGIVLDDEPILIEDSQSQLLDKDALALLAVEAAENQQELTDVLQSTDTITWLPSSQEDSGVINHDKKIVPYLKKSSLWQCCFDCKKTFTDETKNNLNSTSITLETNNFITTIKISNLIESDVSMDTAQIQTDINKVLFNKSCDAENKFSGYKMVNDNDMQSQDIFLENKLKSQEKQEVILKERAVLSPSMFELSEDVSKQKKHIVIEDSDSDGSSLEVNLLHVKADVHRSCQPLDYGILAEVDKTGVLNRPRKKLRGATPDSNNSSDKENCDPNKNRKRKISKKSKQSKKKS